MDINTFIRLLEAYGRISAFVSCDCGDTNARYHLGSALQFIRSYLNLNHLTIKGTPINIACDCTGNYYSIVEILDLLTRELDDKYFIGQIQNTLKELGE